jgi:hypothetical protein
LQDATFKKTSSLQAKAKAKKKRKEKKKKKKMPFTASQPSGCTFAGSTRVKSVIGPGVVVTTGAIVVVVVVTAGPVVVATVGGTVVVVEVVPSLEPPKFCPTDPEASSRRSRNIITPKTPKKTVQSGEKHKGRLGDEFLGHL